MKTPVIIAIDGPAGSGKSSVAKALAQSLGYVYLDTGAMYRALTYLAITEGISLEDEAALEALARNNQVSFTENEDGLQVFIGSLDVTKEIRSELVDAHVSQVSAHPKVRELMVEQQRAIGKQHNLVAEGRDMATVVFPEASLKVFLSADAKTRAKRRYLQNVERLGLWQTYEGPNEEEIYKSIIERDAFDSSRENSPLKPAPDSILIDSSHLNEYQVLQYILKLLEIQTQGGILGKE